MSLTALFALCGGAAAQQVAVADVEALPGETVSLAMQLDTDGGIYMGLEFDIQFPCEGFSTTGTATTTRTSWDGAFTIGDVGGVSISNLARCGVLSYSDMAIPGDGLLDFGTVEFTVGAGLALGSYTVTMTNMTLVGDNRVPVPETTFTLNVVDKHTVVLDENATVAPTAATGVNVQVKRTIKPHVWNTIVLPFAMTEAQTKTAFGDDVEIADFSSWSSEEDDDGDIIGINIGFANVTEMEANHPYIIKVSEALTEFLASDVDIDPEEEPTKQVGTKKAERGYLTGTYVAGTIVPKENLYISDNKFWYSVGSTTIKAFRAYFELADVLSSYASGAASRAIRMSFNPETTTGIVELPEGALRQETIYNLNGQQLKTEGKGVYIKNSKKYVKK